jgi:hypothetical protein
MLTAAAAAVGSGAVGLISMIRHRERSPLVIGSVVLGSLVVTWTALEIVFPH